MPVDDEVIEIRLLRYYGRTGVDEVDPLGRAGMAMGAPVESVKMVTARGTPATTGREPAAKSHGSPLPRMRVVPLVVEIGVW